MDGGVRMDVEPDDVSQHEGFVPTLLEERGRGFEDLRVEDRLVCPCTS